MSLILLPGSDSPVLCSWSPSQSHLHHCKKHPTFCCPLAQHYYNFLAPARMITDGTSRNWAWWVWLIGFHGWSLCWKGLLWSLPLQSNIYIGGTLPHLSFITEFNKRKVQGAVVEGRSDYPVINKKPYFLGLWFVQEITSLLSLSYYQMV